MKYHQIIKQDTSNGIGLRVSIFVSGCRIRCKECHNPKGQDFGFGMDFTQDVIDGIVGELNSFPIYDGLSVLGGEPTERENVPYVLDLVKQVKERTGKSVWVYTGRSIEGLRNLVKFSKSEYADQVSELLRTIDVLVDGEFMIDKKDIMLSYRGSYNQRIIDMKESIRQGRLVELVYDVPHVGMVGMNKNK